jgi:ribosomal protein S18 acetylase RimI-like enzyme
LWGDVAVRRATREDVDSVATVFGEAFDAYARGLGIDAPSLARLWHASFVARVARTLVAIGADGRVSGFAIAIMPGEEEFATVSGRRERPPFREVVGMRGFWRMPVMFVPMMIAFARRRPRSNEAYLSVLGVTPAARGRGIAGALLGVVESRARRAGASGILLHTARENVSARRAYDRAGYRVVAITRSLWRGPDGIDGYVAMLRSLS